MSANAPGTVSTTSGKVIPVAELPSGQLVVAPKNVEELKAVKAAAENDPAIAGALIAAPRAPASGNVDHPSGSVVTVVLQNFWKNPTVRWVLGILTAALLSAGPAISDLISAPVVDWPLIWSKLKAQIVIAAFAAFMLRLKTQDNNAANLPGKG